MYGPLFAYGVFIDTLFLWTLDVLLKPLDTAVDSRQLQVMLFVIKTTRHDKLLASWPHPNIYLCVYNKHQSGHSPNMVVTLCCSENSSQSVTLALFHLAKTRLKVKQKHSVENSISILDFKKHHFDCYTSSGTIIVCSIRQTVRSLFLVKWNSRHCVLIGPNIWSFLESAFRIRIEAGRRPIWREKRGITRSGWFHEANGPLPSDLIWAKTWNLSGFRLLPLIN